MDRKVNDFASCVGFYRRHGSLSGFFQGGSAILNGSGAWVGRPALDDTLSILPLSPIPGADRMVRVNFMRMLPKCRTFRNSGRTSSSGLPLCRFGTGTPNHRSDQAASVLVQTTRHMHSDLSRSAHSCGMRGLVQPRH